jgi:molybdopterin-guanine dinucleotide biosynthesis protein A
MCLLEPDLVRMLCSRTASNADVVVPVIRVFYEPLCAVYKCNTKTEIAGYIDSGKSKTTGFSPSVRVDEVPEAVIRI